MIKYFTFDLFFKRQIKSQWIQVSEQLVFKLAKLYRLQLINKSEVSRPTVFFFKKHLHNTAKRVKQTKLKTKKMQTRSSVVVSTENQNSVVAPNSTKAKTFQSMKDRLSQTVKKVKEQQKQQKRREDKRKQKEQFAFQKLQLKSRCLNNTTLNFCGDYAESDEQVRTRLHSHLLTGRVQNRALQAFALEVFKKFSGPTDLIAQEINSIGAEEFRVPQKTFKRAAKKATELVSSIPKSILKRHISDMDLASADLSLRRQIRALKRSERSKALFRGESKCSIGAISPPCTSPPRQQMLAFESSDSHFLKQVMQHPERDIDIIRVIDQPSPSPSQLAIKSTSAPLMQQEAKRSKPSTPAKSSLQSLDLATRAQPCAATAKASPSKKSRRLVFNDTIEVYYYPENKAQHEHHEHGFDESEDFDDDEEYLENGDDQQLSSFEETRQQTVVATNEQEQTDPTFEQLLLGYMTHQLIPMLKAKKSSSEAATQSKKGRRARASSMTSVNACLKTIVDDEAAGSDSDKSLSTNEHSLPTASGCSSGLNSASNEACSPPSMSSRLARGNRCSYESAKHEIIEIDGVTTVTPSMTGASPQTASPNLFKQVAQKRQRLTASTQDHDLSTVGSSAPTRRCLF